MTRDNFLGSDCFSSATETATPTPNKITISSLYHENNFLSHSWRKYNYMILSISLQFNRFESTKIIQLWRVWTYMLFTVFFFFFYCPIEILVEWRVTVEGDFFKNNLLLQPDVIFDSESNDCYFGSLAPPGGEKKKLIFFFTKWPHALRSLFWAWMKVLKKFFNLYCWYTVGWSLGVQKIEFEFFRRRFLKKNWK